jgi:hypothetical protein
MEVVIDGVRYVPEVEVVLPEDNEVMEAVRQLVSMLYLYKHNPHAWDVLNTLAPNVAELVSVDPAAANRAVNPHEED